MQACLLGTSLSSPPTPSPRVPHDIVPSLSPSSHLHRALITVVQVPMISPPGSGHFFGKSVIFITLYHCLSLSTLSRFRFPLLPWLIIPLLLLCRSRTCTMRRQYLALRASPATNLPTLLPRYGPRHFSPSRMEKIYTMITSCNTLDVRVPSVASSVSPEGISCCSLRQGRFALFSTLIPKRLEAGRAHPGKGDHSMVR